LNDNCIVAEYGSAPGANLSHSQMLDSITCAAYITGVRDAQEMAKAAPNFPPHCTPGSVTTGQIRKIFTKFMSSRPQLLHGPAALNVHAALVDAFPCKK